MRNGVHIGIESGQGCAPPIIVAHGSQIYHSPRSMRKTWELELVKLVLLSMYSVKAQANLSCSSSIPILFNNLVYWTLPPSWVLGTTPSKYHKTLSVRKYQILHQQWYARQGQEALSTKETPPSCQYSLKLSTWTTFSIQHVNISSTLH